MADERKIFVVLKNPEWDKLKPEKIHLFSKAYPTDKSKELIELDLNYGLEDFKKIEVVHYEEEHPHTYWKYILKNFFIDYFVTPDLFDDVRAWEEFRVWLENTIIQWASPKFLQIKIERNKDREYYLKFIINIPS